MRRVCAFASAVCLLTLCCFSDETASEQFGAKRIDFTVGESHGFIILPKHPAADGSKPWVWYAPTFIGKLPDDSHTWMAAQLLEAGFAICGVDVGESCGNPKGRENYSAFHDYVCAHYGLDVKACLLPQSRGGLMLLNWAAENTGKVQCIAGIYTVCNIESYPGLEKAAAAYGMTSDALKASLSQHNPIDRVKPIADAKIPVLFIHGDVDSVVPIEKNSGEYVKRCKALGGNASVIVVQGKGHEVCPQFFQSTPFLTFLLNKGAEAPKS